MVGAAGNVILFVCIGVLWLMVATYTFLYAARCYLVVVQGTASGIDRVEWADEPIVDWVYWGLYVGAILFFWMLPVGVLSRALQNDWLVGHAALRFVLLAGSVLWFFFPISLLSSLGPTSTWAIPSLRALGRLFRILPSVLVFYLFTAALVAATAALAYVGLFTSAFYVLALAGVLLSAVLLVHGRLVGRLGWLMAQLEERPAAPRKSKRGKKPGKAARASEVDDPWATPEDEPQPTSSAEGGLGYRVVEVEQQETRPPAPSYLDNPDPQPYTLETEAPPTGKPESPRVSLAAHQVGRELELRSREGPKPPAFPLFSGVYNFPLYETSRKAWLWLTLFLLATLGLTRALVMLWPF